MRGTAVPHLEADAARRAGIKSSHFGIDPILGFDYLLPCRSSRGERSRSSSIHDQAEQPLRDWYMAVAEVEWQGPADVKAQFGATVDFVKDNRLIFDIAGNKFRLVVHVAYPFKRVLVKFIGTHHQYDRIDPSTV
jgi:mRNA interferase HigB